MGRIIFSRIQEDIGGSSALAVIPKRVNAGNRALSMEVERSGLILDTLKYWFNSVFSILTMLVAPNNEVFSPLSPLWLDLKKKNLT